MIQIDSTNKQNCVGCGACMACPNSCITMKYDEEGFLYPSVDKEKCTECGLCEKVCPVCANKLKTSESSSLQGDGCSNLSQPIVYGGYHSDDSVREDSSSGGAFTLFATEIINKGGIVFGCGLNDDMKAVYMGVESIEDIEKLRGSKYVQSEIGECYKLAKEALIQDRYVLFVGTPCQTSGLKSFLGKDYEKLYTCDFICHGVPSPKVFEKYIASLEKSADSKVKMFKFRNKDTSWDQSGLQQGTLAVFENGDKIRRHPAFKDSYMNGFLSDLTLRPSCYNCAFKENPQCTADIMIADFWGVDSVDPMLNDKKGTSLIILNNNHGVELFDSVKSNFVGHEVDYTDALRKNPTIKKSANKNLFRKGFFHDFARRDYKKLEKKYLSAFFWAFNKVFSIFWSKQFLKFGLVGLTNSAVSYGVNVLTLLALKPLNLGYDYVLANITAFGLSVLWSYNLNSRIVFKAEEGEVRSKGKTLLKTYASYAFSGIVLNNLLGTLWIQGLGISRFISPLLNLIITVPTNFILNKFWAYANKKR